MSRDEVSRVTLVIGPEEFLAERAVERVVADVRRQVPQAERRVIDATAEDAAAQLADALSPNLFADSFVVVVEALDEAADELAAGLRRAVTDVPDHVWLVLVHPGGIKGKALLTAVREAGAAEVACPAVKRRRDGVDFVTREFRRHRRATTREAVTVLCDAIGVDLRMLASAVAQLAEDVEADPIDAAAVSQYFAGVADVAGFEVSDAVWDRRPADALRDLRWLAETQDRGRIGPPTVGAIAAGARGLGRCAGVPPGTPDAQTAREVGVPPWKVKMLRAQLHRWRPDQLAAAILRLADADAAVKGGLREGESLDPVQKLLVLERLVVDTIADPGRSG